jgi:hypothetical protein
MFKDIIPYFINLSLEQVLREQKRLLGLPSFSESSGDYMPLTVSLSQVALDMQLWLLGKSEVRDPINHFRQALLRIEEQADVISLKLWRPNLLNVSCVLDYADQEKERIEGKFPFMLRAHLSIQRMRLLEQVRGARLLQNNSDLGDEVEKIIAEYLSANLESDLLVVRGGHIFDLKGNRSDQMDVIVVPAWTLPMCPSDTSQGRVNVLVDQVIAAISVKSTLTPGTFEDAWKEIQSIPLYEERDKDHPRLAGSKHAWPLCFIVGANSSALDEIDRKWDELIQKGQCHQLQLFLSLERGYRIAGNFSWPVILQNREDRKGSFNGGEDLQAGLGLGWMSAGISARSAVITNKSIASFWRMRNVLNEAGILTGCGCPTYSPKYNTFGFHGLGIVGPLKWGPLGKWLHNRLDVSSVEVSGARLVDPSQPLNAELEKKYPDGVPFEPRWFLSRFHEEVDGKCHLIELKKAPDGKGYVRVDAFFDVQSGVEYGQGLAPLAGAA